MLSPSARNALSCCFYFSLKHLTHIEKYTEGHLLPRSTSGNVSSHCFMPSVGSPGRTLSPVPPASRQGTDLVKLARAFPDVTWTYRPHSALFGTGDLTCIELYRIYRQAYFHSLSSRFLRGFERRQVELILLSYDELRSRKLSRPAPPTSYLSPCRRCYPKHGCHVPPSACLLFNDVCPQWAHWVESARTSDYSLYRGFISAHCSRRHQSQHTIMKAIFLAWELARRRLADKYSGLRT